MTTTTDYVACETCGTRILPPLRHFPALNWAQDPAGQVAVTFTHPRAARWLKSGEEPGRLEHRHSVHQCGAVAEVTG